jgi:hypothetical protein
MIEYKYIRLEDDRDPTATALKTVVDKLEPLPKKYISKIFRNGDGLQVTWSTWKPTAVDRPAFQQRICTIAGTKTYENVVSPRFVLPPSLESALKVVGDGRNPTNCSLEDLDQLHLWGLADVDYDFDYITAEFKSPSEGVLYFKKSLVRAVLTEKGRTYLAEGSLESLR